MARTAKTKETPLGRKLRMFAAGYATTGQQERADGLLQAADVVDQELALGRSRSTRSRVRCAASAPAWRATSSSASGRVPSSSTARSSRSMRGAPSATPRSPGWIRRGSPSSRSTWADSCYLREAIKRRSTSDHDAIR